MDKFIDLLALLGKELAEEAVPVIMSYFFAPTKPDPSELIDVFTELVLDSDLTDEARREAQKVFMKIAFLIYTRHEVTK